MDELAQLRVILKNSFAGIKSDMDEIKDRQSESLAASHRIKEDVDKIKDDYVSTDKLNALKIKVGDVNDTIKKLWELDSSIKAVDAKKFDKVDFEARFVKLKDEIQKKLFEINTNTTKKIVEYSNALTKNIEQVNNNAAKVFSRIDEQMKFVATKGQIKEVVDNFTQEFIAVKKEVAEIRKIKDVITASELDRRTGILNARVDLIAKEILKTNQNVSNHVTSEQVKGIVDSINHEFDSIKVELSDLAKLRTYIGLVESETVSKKEFSRQLSNLQSEIDSERKEMRELKERSREYAKYTDIEKNMKGLEVMLTRRVLDLEKEVMALKRFERRYDSESASKSRIYEQPAERVSYSSGVSPHSIEDKCKAINSVIGRVYRSSNNGSDSIRNSVRINSTLYNDFETAEKTGSKKKMLKTLKQIGDALEKLKKSEKSVFGGKAKKLRNLVRDNEGGSRIIDVLAKNDQDPVMGYYNDALEAYDELKAKLHERSSPVVATAEIKSRPDFFAEKKSVNWVPFVSAVSILLIVLAFVGLAGAIISYFALEPAWTNYLTIGAIIAFVLGIVLRVVVVKKRRN